ncbi:unnamed protein product [Victoria cruziana]
MQGLAAARRGVAGRGLGDGAAQAGFDLGRILFGDHAAIKFERHLARHDVGVGAAFDQTYIEVGVVDAFDCRAHLQIVGIELVERVQDVSRPLQRVDTAVWNGGMGHIALHSHLKLQAAVVGRDHLVAETGRDHQIRLGVAVLQQPARAKLAAKLFVVGEVQLDAAVLGFGDGLECPHCVRVGGEVALAHGGGAAVHLAVHHLGTIGVVGPAFAGRHHVTMGIERDGWATRAITAAHDEVGDALQAGGVDLGLGHGIGFNLPAPGVQQFGRALGVGCVVARRRVGGHAHKLAEEGGFFVEMLVWLMGRSRCRRWPAAAEGSGRRAPQGPCPRWCSIRAGCG